jgi:hypothetical protein
MVRFHRNWAIKLSGMIWFAVGMLLMIKGLKFLVMAGVEKDHFLIQAFGGGDQAIFFLIVLGLLVGFLKGRFVLHRSAERIIGHMMALPENASWKQVYPPRYYVLLAVMMGLGFILRYVPIDVRGVIDVAIGAALMNGAMTYLRARVPSKEKST